MFAIGDSLRDLASSDDQDNGEDEDDEDTEVGKLREDDEPGWVVGTISKIVQQHMRRFWHMQMKLDEMTQPGWWDAADLFCDRDKKYRTTKWKVLAVVNPQMDEVAATLAATALGEQM